MGKGGKKRRATAKDLAMLSAEAAAEGSAEPPEGLAGGVRANVRAAGDTWEAHRGGRSRQAIAGGRSGCMAVLAVRLSPVIG